MKLPKLRRERARRALTQAELAEKAGLSRRSVAAYEAGDGAHPQSIRKLAEALNVEVEDLIDPDERCMRRASPTHTAHAK